MKKQIKRLSPHQNGKVIGVLGALSSLPFFIPLILMMELMVPAEAQAGAFPTAMLVVFPIFYLVFGYVFVAIACVIYNLVAKCLGGIEFEVEEVEA